MKANEEPENYPIKFKDKIDEYLWKEHHIIGGSCSSIESLKYTVAKEVAEKLADAFIKKAVEWLKEQKEMVGISFQDDFIERFQIYMNGE